MITKTEAPVFQAARWHRTTKPYGVGKTRDERASYIVGGWRAEIISGLKEGEMVYTGVCETLEDLTTELIAHLRNRGYSGILRFT